MRTFSGGATRDDDQGKPDYEGYFSPLVIERFGQYMLKHQVQADGTTRASDNWQKGIPREQYMKSLWRHFVDVWLQHRGYPGQDTIEDSLTALMFNTMGYLHETVKARLSANHTPAAGPRLTRGDCSNRTCGFAGDACLPADPGCFKPKEKGA